MKEAAFYFGFFERFVWKTLWLKYCNDMNSKERWLFCYVPSICFSRSTWTHEEIKHPWKNTLFIDCISLFYNKQQGWDTFCFHFENGEFSLLSPFEKKGQIPNCRTIFYLIMNTIPVNVGWIRIFNQFFALVKVNHYDYGSHS